MQRRFVPSGLVARNLLWRGTLLVSGVLLVSAALAQEKKPDGKPDESGEGRVNLKVIVPLGYEEDDGGLKEPTLLINDTQTNKDRKQTGKTERKFESSSLKPGKDYYYTLKVTWEPNNYTTRTRERKIKVEPGKSYTVDLSKPEKDDKPDDIVVRFVATPDDLVDKLMDLAKVGKDDVVFDLGCGDGRMVCRAIAKRGAKRGVGVDIDPDRIKDSKKTAKDYKVEDKVTWREGDVLKQIDDLEDATVVMLYMGDEIGARLAPILQKRLKPGSRVVSHRFTLGDWKPDKTIRVEDKNKTNSEDMVDLHLWTVKERKDGKEPVKELAKEPVKKPVKEKEEKPKP
jgi:uncharacterized protein (TIGR03000 family)